MRWLFGGEDGHGYITPWNPVIAERHAATTARMLLGAVLRVRRQSPDEVRRAQFWREVEARQQRGRVLPLRRSR